MEYLGIVLMCVLAAILYGIVHDQVTARVCVEYFTLGHPRILVTEDPTFLGLAWGVIATWWVGLLLGIPLAVAARVGSRPKLSMQALVRPIGCLLAIMAVVALVAGIVGWFMAASGGVSLLGPIAERIPVERQTQFIAALWAHAASYFVGLIGGVVVIVRTWRIRRKAVSEDRALSD